MEIIFLGVIVLFIILGIVFLNGKGAFLIAGYNTASEKERKKIDEKKLCRYVGILMFLYAGCFVLIMMGLIKDTMNLFWIGFVLFFVFTVVGLIVINIKSRVKK